MKKNFQKTYALLLAIALCSMLQACRNVEILPITNDLQTNQKLPSQIAPTHDVVEFGLTFSLKQNYQGGDGLKLEEVDFDLFSSRFDYVKYLYLPQKEMKRYQLINRFPSLRLVVLPLKSNFSDESIMYLESAIAQLDNQETVIFLYSSMNLDSNIFVSLNRENEIADLLGEVKKAVFVDIHDKCEEYRMIGFEDGIIDEEGLIRMRAKNLAPVYAVWEDNPRLIGEMLCD